MLLEFSKSDFVVNDFFSFSIFIKHSLIAGFAFQVKKALNLFMNLIRPSVHLLFTNLMAHFKIRFIGSSLADGIGHPDNTPSISYDRSPAPRYYQPGAWRNSLNGPQPQPSGTRR